MQDYKTTFLFIPFPPRLFYILQFHLSVGIIGVTYLATQLAYIVGIVSAGQLTDRLVRLHIGELVYSRRLQHSLYCVKVHFNIKYTLQMYMNGSLSCSVKSKSCMWLWL